MTKITIIKDDITRQDTDAIVNAANKSLLGGGGVDGAIHRAAGPQLLEKCQTLNGCETGETKITKGYNLPAKYVIHTVGPIYKFAKKQAPKLLANCYKNSLKLAQKNNIKTISFPSISTGIYGYPIEEAVKVVLKTIKEFIANDDWFDEIRLVVFSDKNLKIYQNLIDKF